MLNIKEIALKVAEEMPSGFLWYEGCGHEAGVLIEEVVEFAEALIESYNAELLKEAGEPVAYSIFICGEPCDVYLNKDDAESEYTRRNERYPDKTRSLQYLFTSDQLAAAILKATKPLEGKIDRLKRQSANRLIGLCKGGEDNDELRAQLAAAQEQQQTTFLQLSHALRIAENQLAKAEQLWQVAQGRCDGLEEKLAKAEQRVAEACAYLAHQHMDADIAADAINNGEWRKFMKEV